MAHARPISISATFIMTHGASLLELVKLEVRLEVWRSPCFFERPIHSTCRCDTSSELDGLFPQAFKAPHPRDRSAASSNSFYVWKDLFPVLKSYTIPTTILAGTHS